MGGFKKCPNGHFYEGDMCPYCITDYIGQNESVPPYECVICGVYSDEYNGGKCPYCGSRLHSLGYAVPSWFPSDITRVVPVCKKCGHRIRRSIPSSRGLVSYIHDFQEKIAPWNYKWDGKCEFCGHDYNVYTRAMIDKGQNKETTVCADSFGVVETGTFDQLTVFSGVTIQTYVGGELKGKVFLSANELKYLMDALKDSPLLEQYDYHFDGT